MRKITSFKDVAVANKEISDHLTSVQNQLSAALKKLDETNTRFENATNSQLRNATTNDLVFTWTGSTGHVAWPGGSLKDTQGKIHVVPPSNLVLTPSTYYWMVWNPTHQKLQAVTGVDNPVYSNPNNYVICQIFTGTNVQSGTAGGGGSTSSRDLSGARYKNF